MGEEKAKRRDDRKGDCSEDGNVSRELITMLKIDYGNDDEVEIENNECEEPNTAGSISDDAGDPLHMSSREHLHCRFFIKIGNDGVGENRGEVSEEKRFLSPSKEGKRMR